MRTVGGRVAVALVSLFVACGGDDDGGGGTTADGGGSTADASGGDGGGNAGGDAGRPDASSPDGGDPDGAVADAALPDAASGPALVTVTFEWAPYPLDSATVFFLRSDDSVIDIVSTDADGRAQAMYDEPGSVVIQFGVGVPTSGQAFLTYLAVPPGTDIYSGGPTIDRSGSLMVTGSVPENPTFFRAETACGVGVAGPTTPVVSVTLQFCRPATHVVWVAEAMVGGQPRVFSAYAPSVPVETGASLTVEGPLREDLVQTTMVRGLPEAPQADGSYGVYSEHGVVQQGEFHGGVTTIDGTLAFSDRLHDLRGLGLRGHVTASILRPGDNFTTFVAWREHEGTPDVDLGPASPALVEGAVFDRTAATWTWTESGPGLVTAARGMVIVEEPGEQQFYWRVLAPNDGTPVRVPRLPPPYERFNIEPASTATSSSLELLGHTRGYGAMLADLEGIYYTRGQAGDISTQTYGFDVVTE